MERGSNTILRRKPEKKLKWRSFIRARITITVIIFCSVLLGTFATKAQTPSATNQSVAAGIYEITKSWHSNIYDFNDDGWQDVLLVRHLQAAARLYRNDFGRFTEINAGTFSKKDRHDCAWGDVNQDSLPDVYCTVGAHGGTATKKNELWIQQPNGTFVDKAVAFGVTDPFGRGRNTTFIHVNKDSYPDLFVGNTYPRQDENLSPNRLFINQNGSSFRNAPEYGLNKEMGGDCAQAADFNNDGWEDLLVCHGLRYKLRLYRNNQGKSFTNVTTLTGIASGYRSDALLVDLNDDGRLDLVTVNRSRFQVQLQKNGVFQPPIAVRNLKAAMSIAAGDVNGDFLPDIYVLQGGDPTTLNYPDLMLLNKNNGTAFVEVPIPQTTQGQGESVSAIDYNNDGKADFIVLNGNGGHKGPVQLIRFK